MVSSNQEIERLYARLDALENENKLLKEKLIIKQSGQDQILDHIFASSINGIIVFDQNGIIIEANPSFCSSINMSRSDILGVPLSSLVPQNMHYKLEKQKDQLNQKESVKITLPIKNRNRLSYYEFTTSKLQKNNLYMSILRDVTEKRLLEKKVKRNEELYTDLFIEALEGIIFWNGNGKIINANEAACRIFECCHEELLTKNLHDFVHKKDDKFRRIIKSIYEKGSIREELVFLMPNDQKKSLEFTIKLHAVDGLNLAIFRNVSERRRMEKELRESELKFRRIFEGALEGFILWNDLLEIVDINQSGERMLQIPKKDLVGRSIINLLKGYRIPNEDLKEQMENIKIEGQSNGIVPINLKSGRKKHFEFSNKHNVFSSLSLTTFKDVTEKLEMEEQLRKSDTLNVIGELAAGIAHEIRNPMTALKGFIQLLEDGMNGAHAMYFNIITTELKRIDSIINEFLILAKPQAVKFEKKDISQIIKETIELLNGQAVLHNVQFNTYYEKDLPLIFCEPNQMKKVFINIIKNAIEVMPNGGEITVSLNVSPDKKLHISIRDEGCGIPSHKIKKLGEPFYTTKERGTGLGLMVTYKIIEEHQGFIEVESEFGRGTVFNIYLPISDF